MQAISIGIGKTGIHFFAQQFLADKILDLLSKTPEHVNSYLYHRVREPNSYAIISEWSSKDAFSSFVQSDVFRQVTNWGKAELLVRRPSHKVYGHERDMR